MKFFIKAVTLLGVFHLAVLANAATDGKLTCRSQIDTLSISQNAQGLFVASLINGHMASLMTREGLLKMFPEADPAMIDTLLKEDAKLNGGAGDLMECGQLTKCDFSSPGSSTLVTCTGDTGSASTNSLRVDLVSGVYKLTCTTTGPMETQEFGLKLKGTGTKTATFQSSFSPQECTVE